MRKPTDKPILPLHTETDKQIKKEPTKKTQKERKEREKRKN